VPTGPVTPRHPATRRAPSALRPPAVRPILPLLLVLGACSSAPAEQGGGGASAALVRIETATDGPLSDQWTVPGEVRALDAAELAAGAAGPVARVTVREGDRVEAGQDLLVVDPAPARARLSASRAAAAETEAALERARRELSRVERIEGAVLSDSERDTARADVATLAARRDSLRAQAREAAVTLERHTVQAPFAGVIQSRYVDPGDWVTPGQRVLDLVSVDRVDVRVDVAQALARQVRPDDPVTLGPVTGTVAAVVPALDPSTRTATVRAIPDQQGVLVPGSSVSVTFPVQRQDPEGAVVPRDALILGPVDTKVARVAEGHAEIVTVDVLATAGDRVLVTGVAPGDPVVVRGNERLRPGQPVRTEVP
jgi:membrane fusion protein, multidrug efflux system